MGAGYQHSEDYYFLNTRGEALSGANHRTRRGAARHPKDGREISRSAHLTPGPRGETFVAAPDLFSLRSPTQSNNVASGMLSDLQNPSSCFPPTTPSLELLGTLVEDSPQGASQVTDHLQVPDSVLISRFSGTPGHLAMHFLDKERKEIIRHKNDGPTSPSDIFTQPCQEVVGTRLLAQTQLKPYASTLLQAGEVSNREVRFSRGNNGCLVSNAPLDHGFICLLTKLSLTRVPPEGDR